MEVGFFFDVSVRISARDGKTVPYGEIKCFTKSNAPSVL